MLASPPHRPTSSRSFVCFFGCFSGFFLPPAKRGGGEKQGEGATGACSPRAQPYPLDPTWCQHRSALHPTAPVWHHTAAVALPPLLLPPLPLPLPAPRPDPAGRNGRGRCVRRCPEVAATPGRALQPGSSAPAVARSECPRGANVLAERSPRGRRSALSLCWTTRWCRGTARLCCRENGAAPSLWARYVVLLWVKTGGEAFTEPAAAAALRCACLTRCEWASRMRSQVKKNHMAKDFHWGNPFCVCTRVAPSRLKLA